MIVRSKLLKHCTNEIGAGEDSDEHIDNPKGDEEDEEIVQMTGGSIQIEKIPMILADNDFIYYIKIKNGLCMIYEGNPKDVYFRCH
jgi:hypothetical protein